MKLRYFLFVVLLAFASQATANDYRGGGYYKKSKHKSGSYQRGGGYRGGIKKSGGYKKSGSSYQGGFGYMAIEGMTATLENPSDTDVKPSGFRLRLGTRIDETFDVETHFGYIRDSSTTDFDRIGASFAGIYLKGYLPVGTSSALFALGGFTGVEVAQEINDQRFTDSRGGFSYGFGLETQLSSNADLTADYVRYIADDGLFERFSAVSFGIKLYF